MKTERLDYKLPKELIAQQPASIRSQARLLVMTRDTGRLIDRRFAEIHEYLRPPDCLVVNDTKVIPARFYARRATGAGLEGLFLSQTNNAVWEVMLKGLGRLKPHEKIIIENRDHQDFCRAELLEKKEHGRCFLRPDVSDQPMQVLKKIGYPALPPYIKRQKTDTGVLTDKHRYQTVYARSPGAVAAPTAGLHFTTKLTEQLKQKGIKFANITLHVGAATFRPVKTEYLQQHKMHSERYNIDERNARIINQTRENSGRIIAVGTTTVRTLETAALDKAVQPGSGRTELFIAPGYRFKMVDAMITNFHLPRSTLLALVAAFAGLEQVLAAYRHAIEKKYRFYSYGDAMLIINEK